MFHLSLGDHLLVGLDPLHPGKAVKALDAGDTGRARASSVAARAAAVLTSGSAWAIAKVGAPPTAAAGCRNSSRPTCCWRTPPAPATGTVGGATGAHHVKGSVEEIPATATATGTA